MSRLVQSGYNPKYPKEIKKYWRFTLKEAPPEWITDNALIEIIKDFPVLSIEKKTDGGLNIRKADINSRIPLVSLDTEDSIIYWTPESGYGSLTPKQLELLYEEKEK